MAARRMFSNNVVDSDEFCALSQAAQLLYFHLGMKADDDGFVQTKKILKLLELDESVLEELESAGFLIRFPDAVCIAHWKHNNQIKADRRHETRFQNYKARIQEDQNKVFRLMSPGWNHSGSTMEPQTSPVQSSQEEISPGQSRPAKPTLADVKQFCVENGLGVNPNSFYETMEGQGWTGRDGRPVVNWKSLVLSWERAEKEHPGKKVSAQHYTQREYTEEELAATEPDIIAEARANRDRGAGNT